MSSTAVMTRQEMVDLLEQHHYGKGLYNKNKSELIDLLQDCDRGILRYELCSAEELEHFAQGLKIKASEDFFFEPGKYLRKCARHRKFRRFLDLPPEVRVMIYKYAFISILDPEGNNVEYLQPPTTRSSTLVRRESLPIWYGSRYFTTRIKRERLRGSSMHQKLSQDSHLFLGFTPREYLTNIRYIRIEWNASDWREKDCKHGQSVTSIDFSVRDHSLITTEAITNTDIHEFDTFRIESYASGKMHRHYTRLCQKAASKNFGREEFMLLAKFLDRRLNALKLFRGLSGTY